MSRNYNPEWVWGPPRLWLLSASFLSRHRRGILVLPRHRSRLLFRRRLGTVGRFWMGMGTRLVWRANPVEWQLSSIAMDSTIIMAAWAAFGRTIPGIGWVFHIRIAPWRVVSVAAGVVAAGFRGAAAFRGGAGRVPGVEQKVSRSEAARWRSAARWTFVRSSRAPAVIAPLAEFKTEAPRECKAITDSPAWGIPASAAVAEDSAVAAVSAVAVDSTVVAEAGDNMTTRIFTLAICGCWLPQCAEPQTPLNRAAAPELRRLPKDSAEDVRIARSGHSSTDRRGVEERCGHSESSIGIVGQRHSHFRRSQAG